MALISVADDDILLSIGFAIYVYKNKTVEVILDLFVYILVNNREIDRRSFG